jgi:hypothetical protein
MAARLNFFVDAMSHPDRHRDLAGVFPHLAPGELRRASGFSMPSRLDSSSGISAPEII